jgi:hypothetical protein
MEAEKAGISPAEFEKRFGPNFGTSIARPVTPYTAFLDTRMQEFWKKVGAPPPSGTRKFR